MNELKQTNNIACRLFKEQLDLINQLPEQDRANVLYMAVMGSYFQFDSQFENQIDNQNEHAYISTSISLSNISLSVLELLKKNIIFKEYSSNYGGKRERLDKTSITHLQDDFKLSNSGVKDEYKTLKDKDKDKDKDGDFLANASFCKQMIASDSKSNKKPEENKYGELGLVRLTTEQYNTLSSKYPSIDKAIEVLDTYLGTSGKKYRNQNHYAFFKSNSWVWERVDNSSKDKKEDSDPTVFIDMDSGVIDITDEANESLSKLGEDSYNKLMSKLRENFNGRNVKRSSISKYIISFEKNERVEQKQDYQYPTLSDFNNLLERNKQ